MQKKRRFNIEFKLNRINKAKNSYNRKVTRKYQITPLTLRGFPMCILIKSAHYYAILAEGGVLFEGRSNRGSPVFVKKYENLLLSVRHTFLKNLSSKGTISLKR